MYIGLIFYISNGGNKKCCQSKIYCSRLLLDANLQTLSTHTHRDAHNKYLLYIQVYCIGYMIIESRTVDTRILWPQWTRTSTGCRNSTIRPYGTEFGGRFSRSTDSLLGRGYTGSCQQWPMPKTNWLLNYTATRILGQNRFAFPTSYIEIESAVSPHLLLSPSSPGHAL